MQPEPCLLDVAAPDAELPSVQLASHRRHPNVFRKMIGSADQAAKPGDLVAVFDPEGRRLGCGWFNPRAEISLRMLCWGKELPNQQFWTSAVDRAVGLRRDVLKLDRNASAYRVVHGEADGWPGIVIDRYADVLSAEVYTWAGWQRIADVLDRFQAALGTSHRVVQAPVQTHGQEGFVGAGWSSEGAPDRVVIEEYGSRFQVRFSEGHKTGFFCDQRDNRRRLADFTSGKSVLDLCCYTGGFSVQASRLGNAADVTGVDLDENALEAAKENARLNGCKIRFVQSDAFGYLRDLIAHRRQFDVVVVDPPKLIRNRSELESGSRAHHDLNRLAFQVVKPGGVVLTCTCCGLLSTEEFRQQVLAAARHADSTPPESSQPWRPTGRSVQILDQTGAAPDHPVLGTAPETEYLRAMWLRVW